MLASRVAKLESARHRGRFYRCLFSVFFGRRTNSDKYLAAMPTFFSDYT